MKNLIRSAVVTLLAASTAQAQQAVQWKVSEGGNGHWYFCTPCTTGLDAESKAGALRAHLVTVTTAGENAYVRQLLAASGRSFAMLGLVQLDSQPAPQLGWTWATGEPVVFANWTDFDGAYGFSAPDDRPCAGGTPQEDNQCNQGLMYLDGRWDDVERGPSCAGFASSSVAVLEWSADCNGDGIVDYGQCRDGTLPDYNGNNVPDCCESGTPCVVGNYPVQWRVAEGGNGHWYSQSGFGLFPSWSAASEFARSRGAYLATLTSQHEQNFVAPRIRPGSCETWGGMIWLGGQQPPGLPPSEGWTWITNEPWGFSNWSPGEPSDFDGWPEDRLCMYASTGLWNDGTDLVSNPGSCNFSAMLEWSADCNNDGLVDKGQILRGQLADSDNDGIPNVCECVCDVFRDFNVNGIDLGILLGQWGPANQFTVTDFNRDGVVDGSDLGLLLASWGPCP